MRTNSRLLTWVDRATPYEAVSLALQMELGAARHYTAMAAATCHRLARAKLRYLAEEEREHARLLADLRRSLERPQVMHALPRHPSEIKARRVGDNPQAAIRLAIRGEQDSEKFYRQCAERCQKGAARQMFEKLADREHQHEIALREELGEVRGDFAWRSLEGAAPVEEDFWA